MSTLDLSPAPAITTRRPPSRKWRGWWLKQLHNWHWISAAVSLVTMLLFALTGITLNHAASITATPHVSQRAGTLPASARRPLARSPSQPDAPVPGAVAGAIRDSVGLDVSGRAAEWSEREVYVALPRPGGDAWVSVDRVTGRITAEVTDRGWISWLNDLHKGRNAGAAWFWFIDLFGVACLIFTLSGLLLLQLHARHRRSTWPLVAVGLAVPAFVAVFLIH
ncbi:PepSY-associated TM helix domain-containing protein [Sphingomonas sp. DT-51]|uniref:PepSY-associated TM helix domain-containing protein n=1 Tax=Sphingomonas sp. DT-51 TaxID=3396165 RepID=UPI003F1A311A